MLYILNIARQTKNKGAMIKWKKYYLKAKHGTLF
jgi:hypothetical protein